MKQNKLKPYVKNNDTSFNWYINSKSNKSRDVKFLIAISKNHEPP